MIRWGCRSVKGKGQLWGLSRPFKSIGNLCCCHHRLFAAKGIIQSPITSCSRRDHSDAAAFAANGIDREGVTGVHGVGKVLWTINCLVILSYFTGDVVNNYSYCDADATSQVTYSRVRSAGGGPGGWRRRSLSRGHGRMCSMRILLHFHSQHLTFTTHHVHSYKWSANSKHISSLLHLWRATDWHKLASTFVTDHWLT